MDGTPPPKRSPYIRSRGMNVPKDPDITKGRMRGSIRAGTYEGKECDAIQRIMRKDDRVLELGAGIGYVSTLISCKTKAASVHSFEANPALLPYIARMHDANDVTNVTVENALVMPRKTKPVPFYVRESFLASSLDGDVDPETIIDTVQIETKGLSTVLKEVKPTVLVCDIEGAEADLLPAGDWTGLRAAIIELHPQWIGQSGVQAVFDAMHKAGLTYFPRTSEGKVVTFRRGF